VLFALQNAHLEQTQSLQSKLQEAYTDTGRLQVEHHRELKRLQQQLHTTEQQQAAFRHDGTRDAVKQALHEASARHVESIKALKAEHEAELVSAKTSLRAQIRVRGDGGVAVFVFGLSCVGVVRCCCAVSLCIGMIVCVFLVPSSWMLCG